MDKNIVEFWPMLAADVGPSDAPHEVECASQDDAIALEAKFHGVGWAARVVSQRVERSYPTAGTGRVRPVSETELPQRITLAPDKDLSGEAVVGRERMRF